MGCWGRKIAIFKASLDHTVRPCLKITGYGDGEMDQWLRAVTSKDPCSVPSTHLTANNSRLLHFQGIWCLLLVSTSTAWTWCTDLQANQSYTFKKKGQKDRGEERKEGEPHCSFQLFESCISDGGCLCRMSMIMRQRLRCLSLMEMICKYSTCFSLAWDSLQLANTWLLNREHFWFCSWYFSDKLLIQWMFLLDYH